MTRTLWVLVLLALMTFAFSVAFVVATLAGLNIPLALIAGEAAAAAQGIASIVMSLVRATIIQEERLTLASTWLASRNFWSVRMARND